MSTPPRRTGISYTRFSSPEQAKGDSESRQQKMFRDFCQRHDLTPLRQVFADRGKSGYKDEHRRHGKLGQLIAMAKDGRFDPGTVIVIEAWDRLGRLRPDVMVGLVSDLLRTGVAIGICTLNDIFTLADFGSHKWTILATFVQLAHQESKQKGQRVAEAWQGRRDDTRKGDRSLDCRLPAWLEHKGGKVVAVPYRAKVVKRIFKLAAEGLGHARIVRALDTDEVLPFGPVRVNAGRVRSQFCGKWTRPYIRLILSDRRAVGELQLYRTERDEVNRERMVPDGPPLANIYPAVVTEEEFQLAKQAQASRRGAGVPRERQRKFVNLFQGLLRHSKDGQGFTLHSKYTKGVLKLVLVSHSGKEGREPYVTFNYTVLEQAILGQLKELDPADVLPRKAKGLSRAAQLRGEQAKVRTQIAAVKADLKRQFSRGLADVLRDLEADDERLAGELQEELAKGAGGAERAWGAVKSLADIAAAGSDADRLRLRVALRQVVESVWLLVVTRGSWRFCAAQVFFPGDGSRSYLVTQRTAGNGREGCWAVRSFAEAGVKGTLDLRDAKHVAKLEKFLAGVELPG
jgi:DNA invertase Pin-like site-specific DNA recombinase